METSPVNMGLDKALACAAKRLEVTQRGKFLVRDQPHSKFITSSSLIRRELFQRACSEIMYKAHVKSPS
jgi:hypothetical protein